MARKTRAQAKEEARLKQVEEINKITQLTEEEALNVGRIFLTNEQHLMIKFAELEFQTSKKDVQTLFNKGETLERDRIILNLQMADLKSRSIMKQRQYESTVKEIGAKIGVDLFKSSIHPESGEIILP